MLHDMHPHSLLIEYSSQVSSSVPTPSRNSPSNSDKEAGTGVSGASGTSRVSGTRVSGTSGTSRVSGSRVSGTSGTSRVSRTSRGSRASLASYLTSTASSYPLTATMEANNSFATDFII